MDSAEERVRWVSGHAYEGVRNVLKHYGLLEGDVVKIDRARETPPRLVRRPNSVITSRARATTYVERLVEPGAEARAGDPIGRLHDSPDHSSQSLEICAHRGGVVIALYFGAVCRKGLTLFVIAEDVLPPL